MDDADIHLPALCVDVDALDFNIRSMADRAAAAGVALRPHAKAHKCPEIARRTVAAGAIGASCATLGEAEALASAGIGGLLVTSPVHGPASMARLARMRLRGADVTVVVDDPAALPELAEVAEGGNVPLPVIVELDVGQSRTGCRTPEDAVRLAREIVGRSQLTFAGVQAYWGHLQQVMPLSARREKMERQGGQIRRLLDLLGAEGISAPIVTGGGTGTSAIDMTLGLFSEIQPGSYLLLDSAYSGVDIDGDGMPFAQSLFVIAEVVSALQPGRAIVNAGLKAFATDSGKPVPVRGAPAGATYTFMGDEHGAVDYDPGAGALSRGDRVEFLTSHCDPTVNLYSRYLVRRGSTVVDAWPIAARY